MTEADWLASSQAHSLLHFLHVSQPGRVAKPSARKYRLLACGCARVSWGSADIQGEWPEHWSAVEVAERLADRLATPDKVLAARNSGANGAARKTLLRSPRMAANDVCGILHLHRGAIGILHCVLGNPFRPVAVDPAWLTSTAVNIAQVIYDDRVFDRLPILADALQDAGCENADILGHCRGDGPHARGCWVVDLVLGKE